jgi:general secretion pathway protein G
MNFHQNRAHGAATLTRSRRGGRSPLQREQHDFCVAVSTARRCQAFTQGENLLLIVVLAILMATVCPKIFSQKPHRRYSKISEVHNNLAQIKTALHFFQLDTGYYPKGTNGLLELLRQPPGATNWHGPYLAKIPPDPWGHAYHYDFPGKHGTNDFDVWSAGASAAAGSIGNWSMAR